MDTPSLKAYSPQQILDMILPDPVVRVSACGHEIELKATERYWYPVEVKRCNTRGKMLHWIRHLSEKNWVTTEHIRQFIDCCTRVHGKKVDPYLVNNC